MQQSSIFVTKPKTQSAVMFYLLFPLSLTVCEIAAKLSVYGLSFDKSWLFVLLFSIGAGALLTAVAAFLPENAARIFTIVVCACIFVFFSFQIVYYKFFKNFFLWQTLGMAGNLTDFIGSSVMATLKQWYMLLIFALPLIFVCVFKNKIDFSSKPPVCGICAIAAFLLLNGADSTGNVVICFTINF